MSAHSMHFPVLGSHHVRARSVSIGQVWGFVTAMLQARQTRRMLGEMDQRMLADIGVGRGDALVEAARPMWDLAPRSH